MTGPTDIEIERAVEVLNNNHWHIVADMMLTLKRRAEAAEKERDALHADVVGLLALNAEYSSTIEAAEKREAVLRKALKPFVEASDGEPDTFLIRTDHPMFRRARAALEAKP